MRKIMYLSLSTIVLLLALIYQSSCKKDPCKGITCQNGGTCSNGSCVCPSGYTGKRCELLATTTIKYRNNVFTPVTLEINGEIKTVPKGGYITLTGLYGTTITGTGYTFGTYSNGTQMGGRVNWEVSSTFPASGEIEEPINLSSNVFYLFVVNNSSYDVKTVYVNYGSSTLQSKESITIPNDGKKYGIGYYNVNSSTIIRLESNLYYWSDYAIKSSLKENQSTTFTIK